MYSSETITQNKKKRVNVRAKVVMEMCLLKNKKIALPLLFVSNNFLYIHKKLFLSKLKALNFVLRAIIFFHSFIQLIN